MKTNEVQENNSEELSEEIKNNLKEEERSSDEETKKKKRKNGSFIFSQIGGDQKCTAGDLAIFHYSTDSERTHTLDGGLGKQQKSGFDIIKNKKREEGKDSDCETDNELISKSKTYISSKKNPNKNTFTLSHHHKDHNGMITNNEEYSSRFINHAHIDLNSIKEEDHTKARFPETEEKKLRIITDDDNVLFAWQTKDETAKLYAEAILSKGIDTKTKFDANKISMGALVTCETGIGTDKESKYLILSTGDMEPKFAKENIKKMVGEQKMDIIKLSHHGSNTNLGSLKDPMIPYSAIDNNTKILISGYTMKESKDLLNFLNKKEVEKSNVFLLFNSKNLINEDKILEEGGVNLNNLSKRVFIGKDFHAYYPADGTDPKYILTGFDDTPQDIKDLGKPVSLEDSMREKKKSKR